MTTIVDMPLNSVPPTITVAALEEKQAATEGRLHVDVGFWGGAVPDNLEHLAALHDAGVMGFKCFLLDSGVEEFRHLDPAAFTDAMRRTAELGALLVVHAEDGDLLADVATAPRYADFLASRPPASEHAAIERVVEVAAATGGRAHVVHLSSAGAVPVLRAARAAGAPVAVETCPHYLTFDAEHVPERATELKCCPPIRDAANREQLWAALRGGDIDLVVSDHSPCTPELKQRGGGDFASAWGGIASLQVSLPAVWTGARARGHDLTDVARWMARRPADLVGLAHKGRIEVGADADLVAFAPDVEVEVDVAQLHHRNPVSPYHGRRLAGVVRQTWLRGSPVTFDRPRGRILRRGER